MMTSVFPANDTVYMTEKERDNLRQWGWEGVHVTVDHRDI